MQSVEYTSGIFDNNDYVHISKLISAFLDCKRVDIGKHLTKTVMLSKHIERYEMSDATIYT